MFALWGDDVYFGFLKDWKNAFFKVMNRILSLVFQIIKKIFEIIDHLHLIFKYYLFFFSFFSLSGFSFTSIHESQDCRGRGRLFL